MSNLFAMPIAHQTQNNDYSRFNGKLALGRAFRQPLLTAHEPPDTFSYGLEIFFANDATIPDLANIYCWHEGILKYQPANPGIPGDRLILQREIPMHNKTPIFSLEGFIIEANPYETVYENVDKQLVEQALVKLITKAYTDSTTVNDSKLWHRLMREYNILQNDKAVSLRSYLKANEAHLADQIQWVIKSFLGEAPLTNLQVINLPVQAGDLIGSAATHLASDKLPSNSPFTLTDAKRLTIWVTDYSGQVINPLYYLERCLLQQLKPDNQQQVRALTNLKTSSNTLNHPLINICPALQRLASPSPSLLGSIPARERAYHHLFRFGGNPWTPGSDIHTGYYPYVMWITNFLAEFHGYKKLAKLEWRYNQDGEFEARDAKTQAPVNFPITDDTFKRVDNFWFIYGGMVSRVCEIFQIPCELVIASCGAEFTLTIGQSRFRLERIERAKFEEIDAKGELPPLVDLEEAYNKLANDSYPIPQQASVQGSAPVSNKSTLTWDELFRIVDKLGSGSISPGIMQTMIGTARNMWSIYKSLLPSNLLTELGIPPLPSLVHEWIFWLAEPKASILVGVAYMRHQYRNNQTQFDLTMSLAAYNAGSLQDNNATDWGLVMTAKHVDHGIPYFNAAVKIFNNSAPTNLGLKLLTIAPSVRFMR